VAVSQVPPQQSAPLSADEYSLSSTNNTNTAFSNLAPPPTSMTTSGSGGNGNTPMNTRLESAVCVHAALVELHEHHGLKKSKPYGPKGAAILKSPLDGGYSLLLYAPITKKHEFELELTPKFSFTVLPSLFATFSDPVSKRYPYHHITEPSSPNVVLLWVCCVGIGQFNSNPKKTLIYSASFWLWSKIIGHKWKQNRVDHDASFPKILLLELLSIALLW
jgi:hypothetical protein